MLLRARAFLLEIRGFLVVASHDRHAVTLHVHRALLVEAVGVHVTMEVLFRADLPLFVHDHNVDV